MEGRTSRPLRGRRPQSGRSRAASGHHRFEGDVRRRRARPLATTNKADVPVGIEEPILRRDGREISLLVAHGNLSLTYGSRPAGERVTDPHVHRHTEAFYVLEGELSFKVGAERETITLGAGGVVAVPPGLAHSYGTAGNHQARWLVIHAGDGGFAAFMRGLRDGVRVEWDIEPVPADGGRPAEQIAISRPPRGR